MSEAKVPDYDTCGLFHRLHCIKTLASRPVLICKSYYFFARKEAAGILSYSQFRFFVYFTFLFELGKSKDIFKHICLVFIFFLPLFYLCYIYYFGSLIFCCQLSIPIEISILFGNSEHPFPERKNMPFRSRVQPFI